MLGAYADWQTAALNDGQSIQLFNDSGRSFRFENGALPGLKGEYMIRLVLSR